MRSSPSDLKAGGTPRRLQKSAHPLPMSPAASYQEVGLVHAHAGTRAACDHALLQCAKRHGADAVINIHYSGALTGEVYAYGTAIRTPGALPAALHRAEDSPLRLLARLLGGLL